MYGLMRQVTSLSDVLVTDQPWALLEREDAGMTYDEIVAVFFAPPPQPIPSPTVTTGAARRLRDALEPIATHGWWSRQPMERLAALGLGFFDAYVWGRAAALGTPAASVVVSTFGVFEPSFISGVYLHAITAASRDEVLAARAGGASDSLAELVSAAEADAVAEPLLEVITRLDGMGRPLFNALRELPLPATAQGRLWRASELVREHRGDGHLAACVAAGLGALEANVFTELWLGYSLGEYSGTRGFGPDHIALAVASLERRGWVFDGALTDAGLVARIALEDATDESQGQLIEGLGERVDDVTTAAAQIAERVIAAKAFPSDPRKRAAG